MNYDDPKDSGRIAFIHGIKREENPVSRRTHANAYLEWDRGWLTQSTVTCKGPKCAAINGVNHSLECESAHDEIYRNM